MQVDIALTIKHNISCSPNRGLRVLPDVKSPASPSTLLAEWPQKSSRLTNKCPPQSPDCPLLTMSHPQDKHTPLKHLLSKQPFHPPICGVPPRPLSLSSHTPTPSPSSQLPLSSPSTSNPPEQTFAHTHTDLAQLGNQPRLSVCVLTP